MNTIDIKKAVSHAAELYGAEGYEIKISTSTSAGAEALKDEISSVTYSRSGGMSVRCVKNGKSGYASSELVTAEEAAELVRIACDNALVVDDADEVPLFEGSESYTEVEEAAVVLPSADEMKAHTMEIQKKLYAASDKVVDGSQSFTSCGSGTEVFINSAGLDLCYESALVYHGAVAAVRDGENAQENYEIALMNKADADKLVEMAVSGAISMLGAETVDSGKYNVIFDKGSMRMMLGCFASAFSARSAYLKTTLLAGKEGEVVASENLTICDDPFHPDKYGHCPFDGEGVAVYKKNVIENGVLKTLLYNRMYAKKFGKETTGNASSATHISPKGLYIEAGDLTEAELLAKLDNGIYITELKGLHAGANVQSGDFSLEAAGYLVEGGKKAKAIKNFTIADNFFTLIKKVVALSDTVEFKTSSCGAPEVMFSDISVSGK